MSVFNGAQFLEEAIDSIRTQSFTTFDFLIVDDGSTDSTPQILARHAAVDDRIRILTQENRGLITSLNRAFQEATGTYIARMDADDVSRRYRLEMQMDFMSSNRGITLVGGAIEVVDAGFRRIGPIHLPEKPEQIRSHMRELGCALAHPTVLFRRDAVLKMGGFRKAYKHAEDYDLWLRMLETFDFANMQEILLDYRRHSATVSYQHAAQQVLSSWCARIVAKRRLQGLPDPTDEVELITPEILVSLGILPEQINERIFTELISMTEDSIRCGFCLAAVEFITAVRPFVEPDRVRRAAVELNRKAATVWTSLEDAAKHRQKLLDVAPDVFREVFAPPRLLQGLSGAKAPTRAQAG